MRDGYKCRRRVGFDLIGRAPDDVNAAAIGPPAGNSRGEPLVGVGDSAVVLFLEFVFDRVRSGITALPERLDELLALFVGLQLQERGSLFIADDVRDFFFQPFLVRGGKFLFEFPQVLACALSGVRFSFRSPAACRRECLAGPCPGRAHAPKRAGAKLRPAVIKNGMRPKRFINDTSPLIRKFDSIPRYCTRQSRNARKTRAWKWLRAVSQPCFAKPRARFSADNLLPLTGKY